MAEENLNINCEILVVSGSAGSLEVLLKLLTNLKSSIGFAIVIVLHRKNTHDSTLLDLLSSKTKMPVWEVEDKNSLLPGNIYIAPPDYHLLVENDRTFSLDASEKINFSRPSIDVTFDSIADVFKSKAIAILLSGANSDGTEGLRCIKKNGGTTIVQQPESAQVPFMPQHAISHADIDYVLNPQEMVDFINSLT